MTQNARHEFIHQAAAIAAAFSLSVVFIIIMQWIYHPVAVSGESMYPTYKDGQILTCRPLSGDPALSRGDVCVVHYQHEYIIKRLVGLPGDTLSVVDGQIYINGGRNESLEYDPIDDPGVLGTPLTLHEGEYFFVGDNRDKSFDCRAFGPVTFRDIKYIINN